MDNPEGRVSAILTAFYGIMPWDQNRLTDDQIANLMQEFGYVRYLRDEVTLRAQFGKVASVSRDEDQAKKLREIVRDADRRADDDPMAALWREAWEAWAYPRYGMPRSSESAKAGARAGAAVTVSLEAARGILEDVQAGRLSDAAWLSIYRGGTFRALCSMTGEVMPW